MFTTFFLDPLNCYILHDWVCRICHGLSELELIYQKCLFCTVLICSKTDRGWDPPAPPALLAGPQAGGGVIYHPYFTDEGTETGRLNNLPKAAANSQTWV